MPQQLTFAQAEYAAEKKITRREQFLKEMEQVLPWAALQALIKPHYYRETNRDPGHPSIGLERMLRSGYR
jgi:IS5 family transposase